MSFELKPTRVATKPCNRCGVEISGPPNKKYCDICREIVTAAFIKKRDKERALKNKERKLSK